MSGKKNALIKLMLEKHLTLWNEPDVAIRQAAMAALYSPEIKITTPEGRYKGIEAAGNAIDTFRQVGGVLKIEGLPSMHHNGAYYRWSITKDAQPVSKGIDFVTFRDNLIKSVFTFTD